MHSVLGREPLLQLAKAEKVQDLANREGVTAARPSPDSRPGELHRETARDGQEGLRLVRELRPSAVTLDIMMPDLDGWTVLAAIKGDPALASIPVVLMSIDSEGLGFLWTVRFLFARKLPPRFAPSNSQPCHCVRVP